MNKYNIKVLQDTPFDKKSTILPLVDFKLKYNYIITEPITDEEFIQYLRDDKAFENWFEVIDVNDSNKNLYWGYKHISGTYQAKRYFDKRDIEDAEESPFVEQIVQPFLSSNREDALKYIKIQTD